MAASDVPVRARAAQGKEQTVITFTYFILDRHPYKVGFNILFFLVSPPAFFFFFPVRRISLECPVTVVTARKILLKFEEVS